MAGLTWYLTDNSVGPGSDLSDTDPGAEAYRSPVTGWIVGTGSTNNSAWYNDTERASSTFADTTPPDGSLDTTNGDFWVSPSPLTGVFASGNWNIYFAVRANTGGNTQGGNLVCRLFRGPNQDGSGATEITAAQQSGSAVTNLLTSATQVSTATFNPGSFSVSNEYIFVQIAWARTAGASMTTYDVNARIGNGSGTGSRVVTADFAIGIDVSDTVTVTEGEGNGLVVNLKNMPSVFDSTTLSEGVGNGVVVSLLLSPNVYDGVALSESSAVENRVLPVNVFDTTSVTESVVSYLPISFSVFDSVTVTEYVADTRIPIYFVDVSNVITVTENAPVSISGGSPSIYVFDDVVVNDSIVVSGVLKISVSDNIGVTEYVSAGIPAHNPSVYDDVTVTYHGQIFQNYNEISVSEQVSIFDYPYLLLPPTDKLVGNIVGIPVITEVLDANYTYATPVTADSASHTVPIVNVSYSTLVTLEINTSDPVSLFEYGYILRDNWLINVYDHLSEDRYKDNVTLLCPFEQSVIEDTTGLNTLIANGNAEQSAVQVRYGNYSAYFDGSGDYLSATNSSNFAFGTGDFTIEFWIRGDASFNSTLLITNRIPGSGTAGVWGIRYNGYLHFKELNSGEPGVSSTSPWSPAYDTWYHIAVERVSGYVTLYVDGVSIGGGTFATNFSTTGGSTVFAIGGSIGENYFKGWYDDIRITKGAARYGGNFTLPSSSKYGTISDNVYRIRTAQNQLFIEDVYEDVTASEEIGFYSQIRPSIVENIAVSEFAFVVVDESLLAAPVIPLDSLVPTVTKSTNYVSVGPYTSSLTAFDLDSAIPVQSISIVLSIDANDSLSATDVGYLWRDTWSIDVFDSVASLIPGGPGENISLLFGNDNAADGVTSFDDQSDNNLTLTTYGNTQYDNAQAPTGMSTSVLFDGNDFVKLPNDSVLILDGDFTIEFWLKLNSGNADTYGVGYNLSVANMQCRVNESGTAGRMSMYNGTSTIVTTGVSHGTGWNHFAYSRSGSSLKYFLNGTQVGTTQTHAGTFDFRQCAIGAGINGTSYSGGGLNGWMGPLRITKGVSLYSDTFSVPSLPLIVDSYSVEEYVNVNPNLILHSDVFDAVTITEDVVVAVTEGQITVQSWDSVATTEDVSFNLFLNPYLFDTATLTEVAQPNVLLNQNVFDQATITESAIPNVLVMPSVFDGSTLTESIASNMYLFPTPFDLVTLTDVPQFNVILGPFTFDQVTITESVSANVLLMPSRFDSVTVTESSPVNVILGPLVFDSVTLTEALAFYSILPPNAFDTVTVTESVSTYLVFGPNVFDDVTVTESVAHNLFLQHVVFDLVNVTESVSHNLIVPPNTFDAITITEYAQPNVILGPYPFDTVTVTENNSVHAFIQPILFDSISTTESVSFNVYLQPSIFDTVVVTESSAVNCILGPSIFDAVVTAEDSSLNVILGPYLYEDVALTEFDQEMMNLAPSLWESVEVTELNAENMLLMPVVSEDTTVSEVVETNMMLSPDIWDNVIVTESSSLVQTLLVQLSFRWRNDDNTEALATWKNIQDANTAVSIGTPIRIRILVDGTLDPEAQQFQLEYRKVGDIDWSKVN